MRQFITQVDVSQVDPGGELLIGAEDVLTPSALEEATRRGVVIRQGDQTFGSATPRMRVGGGRVIVVAFGVNRAGVLAELTGRVSALGGNILEISQRIVQEYFHMFMVVDIEGVTTDFHRFKLGIEQVSHEGSQRVTVLHEDIFTAMHRIDAPQTPR